LFFDDWQASCMSLLSFFASTTHLGHSLFIIHLLASIRLAHYEHTFLHATGVIVSSNAFVIVVVYEASQFLRIHSTILSLSFPWRMELFVIWLYFPLWL
jgi:hypothetical protein